MELISVTMWLVFGAVSAYLAKKQGRNPYLWFILGMFLGLFGVFFLFFSPKFKKRKAKADPTTIDVAPTLEPEYQNKFWYYLDSNNQQFGPMSFQALHKAWKEGTVTLETYVWNESLDNWKRLKEFIKTPEPSPVS